MSGNPDWYLKVDNFVASVAHFIPVFYQYVPEGIFAIQKEEKCTESHLTKSTNNISLGLIMSTPYKVVKIRIQ